MRPMNIQEQVADVCRRFGVDQDKALDMIAKTIAYNDSIAREKERAAKAKLERSRFMTGRCVSAVPMVGFSLEHWPEKFAAVPRTGEWVRSREGHVLEVSCVTHIDLGEEPEIEVALKPVGS